MVYTTHAQERMSQRGINQFAIELAIKIGRSFYSKEAQFFFLGKKEVKRYFKVIPLITKYEGIVVVINSKCEVATTYRNRSFLKNFKSN